MFRRLAGFGAMFGWAGLSAAPTHTYQIVAVFPHDPSAFTQGLAFSDGRLFEGTGLYGRSRARETELATGTVLRERPLDSVYFGEGLTVFEDRVYQIVYRRGRAFALDRETLELVEEFSYEGEGWGLTHDGERLIMSDGSDRLFFRDPDTFAVLSEVSVRDDGAPVRRLNELEFVDGEVWANQWLTDRVARIDPESGEVRAWIDFEGLYDWRSLGNNDAVLNGIAFEGGAGRLFVTGKLWPSIFEVRAHPFDQAPAPRLEVAKSDAPGGEIRLSFVASRGVVYTVEKRDAEAFGAWVEERRVVGGGGRLEVETIALNSTFYRVRVGGAEL